MILQINETRFKQHFEALAKIGKTPEGGLNRPTFSDAHFAARKWLKKQILDAGLRFEADGASNHFGYLDRDKEKTLFIGSHLDSVVFGGKYDGALGVLAALETLQMVKDKEIALPFNLAVVDFTDEEGSILSMFGSRAFAGRVNRLTLQTCKISLEEFDKLLTKASISRETILGANIERSKIAGYLEVHIEQGTRLEKRMLDIGVVTSITGIAHQKISFQGEAMHAGTTPFNERKEAGIAAMQFCLEAYKLVQMDFSESIMNIGKLTLEPGAYNIVPASAIVSVEFRSTTQEEFGSVERALHELAREIASNFNVEVSFTFGEPVLPQPTSVEMQKAIEESSERLQLKHTTLPSFAGHDPQSLAPICPVGMFFIPSVGGYSHVAKEFSHWKDCVQGANVLLNSVLVYGEQFADKEVL